MEIKPSFIENIEQSIISHWSQKALTDYQGETLRYSDVARRIEKIHIAMDRLGVNAGDKVAIYGRSCVNWVTAFYAIITRGCVIVPVQNEFRAEQVHNIINHSGTKFLFTGEGIDANIRFDEMPGLIGIAKLERFEVIASRDEKLREVRERLDALFDEKYPRGLTPNDIHYFRDTDPEALALLNYTSGTTGFSKGVMIPYRSLWGNLSFTQTRLARGIRPGGTLVSTLPPAHTFGMTCEVFFGFVYGLHMHFLNRSTSPTIILQMCREVKPVMLVTVPLIIEKIIRKNIFPRIKSRRAKVFREMPLVKCLVRRSIVRLIKRELGGNIRQVFTGGASMNYEIEKFLMDIGFPITSGYGTTETSPMITYSDWTDHVLGSCGTVVPHMEMRVACAAGSEAGEVVCRGKNVMLGYYKNPEETAEVMRDGWFHTGDLGRISDDGHLFLLGRIKNILLGSNGLNIYPEEIEGKLNSLPMVAESVVVQDGQRLVAIVFPEQPAGGSKLSKTEFEAMMEKNRKRLNAMLPVYCKVSEIRLHDKEFEKTSKKSIKRYLYAIHH
ncbi:MAG: AMP-binding protein [Prevotella sp.]|nr:AMP-binding protein [Prevotella sp.]